MQIDGFQTPDHPDLIIALWPISNEQQPDNCCHLSSLTWNLHKPMEKTSNLLDLLVAALQPRGQEMSRDCRWRKTFYVEALIPFIQIFTFYSFEDTCLKIKKICSNALIKKYFRMIKSAKEMFASCQKGSTFGLSESSEKFTLPKTRNKVFIRSKSMSKKKK